MSFNKVFAALLACVLWTATASATYTSATLAAGPDIDAAGTIHYIAVFSGPGESDVKRDVTIPGGATTATIANTLAAELKRIAATLNRASSKDAQLPPVNTVVDVRPTVTPPPDPPPTPTADDLEVAAFQSLVQQWRIAIALLAVQLGTQDQIDMALGALAKPYNDASPTVRARLNDVLVAVRGGVF